LVVEVDVELVEAVELDEPESDFVSLFADDSLPLELDASLVLDEAPAPPFLA
jgi:hypothetical protein